MGGPATPLRADLHVHQAVVAHARKTVDAAAPGLGRARRIAGVAGGWRVAGQRVARQSRPAALTPPGAERTPDGPPCIAPPRLAPAPPRGDPRVYWCTA